MPSKIERTRFVAPRLDRRVAPISAPERTNALVEAIFVAFRGEGDGAQGRNRTTDTVIFSHVLYQLSYLGPPGEREVGL